MDLMFALLKLLAIGCAMYVIVRIGRWILGPLDCAANGKTLPTQFTMLDFLSLIFLFQLPMAAVHWWLGGIEIDPRGPGENNATILMLDGFGWISCGLMWWLSVGTLSRARIQNTWHRAIFLAFVLPVTYFGTLAFVAASFMFFVLAANGQPVWEFGVALLIAMSLMFAFYLSSRFTRYMVAAALALEAEKGV